MIPLAVFSSHLHGSLRCFGALLAIAATHNALSTPPVAPIKPTTTASENTPARGRILLFSKTASFRHDSIPNAIACVKELLADRYDIDATEDATVFTAENLARYRAVVFLSTTGDILNDAQQAAFEGFIHNGLAVSIDKRSHIGSHNSTDRACCGPESQIKTSSSVIKDGF